MRKQCTAATFVAMLAPSYAQLHLITGSPTPKHNQAFASTLFQVGDDGSVKSIAELVPKNVQTQWITVSYDLRTMLIRSNPRIVAVNFDKAAIAKDCAQPPTPPGLRPVVDQWLLGPPSRGATLAEAYFDGSGFAMWGMMMDSLIPCAKSFVPIDASELKFIAMHGRSGVADVGSSDAMGVFPDATGRIKVAWPGAGVTDFGYNLPMDMLSGNTQSTSMMVINNHKLLSLINISDRTPKAKQQTFVLRKADETWHRLPVPTEKFDWQQGFGKFIAVAEAATKGPQSPESAGRAGWRTTDSGMGPSIAARFEDSNVVFPGRLYLYNIDNEHMYTITTNQGDSEILLVDNGMVFYRASNRLYSATITDTGIGQAHLIATDEAIRDAHWAFIKH